MLSMLIAIISVHIGENIDELIEIRLISTLTGQVTLPAESDQLTAILRVLSDILNYIDELLH